MISKENFVQNVVVFSTFLFLSAGFTAALITSSPSSRKMSSNVSQPSTEVYSCGAVGCDCGCNDGLPCACSASCDDSEPVVDLTKESADELLPLPGK